MSFEEERKWNACWIAYPATQVDWKSEVLPAPFFRKEFDADAKRRYTLFLCGLGYHELYLNGRRVDDRELAPAPTCFDRRAGYIRYDLTGLVRDGANTLGVILGNGWFNCSTAEVWHFDKAVWRDNPKLLLELLADGETWVSSDDSWRVSSDGPIRFDALREGEFYDARREFSGWAENGFDDTGWIAPRIVAGPGGKLFRQASPPCRVCQTEPMRPLRGALFDAGVNFAGRALLTVRGERGATVTLRYGDVLTASGFELDVSDIGQFVGKERFQTERYTLKGGGVESWHSRFTYHGFRYVEVTVTGNAELISLEAQSIHSDLRELGEFHCSLEPMNQLEACTRRSFLNNFVGIPTDCPHREKNGWTGDTQLASETGLWHFELTESYREWLATLRDCQRPDGRLPGMAPTSGWGYNWGNGPLFDSALWIIPRNVYIFRGDDRLLRENYAGFKQYLAFLEPLSPSGILRYGLGDWQHWRPQQAVAPELVTTAWYYLDLMTFAETAELFGNCDDAARARERAGLVEAAFLRTFANADGSFANGEKTALGTALYTGLCPQQQRSATEGLLEAAIRRDGCIADFGIAGAKSIPRALGDAGYADTVLEIFTQPEFPGWGKWLADGETTLLEDFAGRYSHDHIMFGDLSAWMFEYAGGIRPSFLRPGFREVELEPLFPRQLDSFDARYETPQGTIQLSWQRSSTGTLSCRARIPDAVPGVLILPDGTRREFNRACEISL